MKQKIHPLDVIEIASPCSADWNAMVGDDRTRYCGDCNLNVYNISEMTRAEAETLINTHEGRLCGRFFRRHDGTIVTRDCPVGLRAVRRRLARSLTAMATMLGFLTFGTLYARGNSTSSSTRSPLTRLASWIEGEQLAIAGDISFGPPQSFPTVPLNPDAPSAIP